MSYMCEIFDRFVSPLCYSIEPSFSLRYSQLLVHPVRRMRLVSCYIFLCLLVCFPIYVSLLSSVRVSFNAPISYPFHVKIDSANGHQVAARGILAYDWSRAMWIVMNIDMSYPSHVKVVSAIGHQASIHQVSCLITRCRL